MSRENFDQALNALMQYRQGGFAESMPAELRFHDVLQQLRQASNQGNQDPKPAGAL